MSDPIPRNKKVDLTAPKMSSFANGSFSTPQNTPASNAPLSSRAQAPTLGSLAEEDGGIDRAQMAGLLASNPKLIGMIQDRLGSLVGKSSGYVESLPPNVRRRVAGLKGIQKEHTELEKKFQEEILELEKKYLAKYQPIYKKRAAIVNGSLEPTDAEVTEGEKGLDGEDEDENAHLKTNPEEAKNAPPVNGIPEFWLTAMKNQPSLVEMITEKDEVALKQLVDVRMEYLDKPGFKLIFEFPKNEFFTNSTLTKSYFYQEESGYGGELIYDHATGDDIKWLPGKDLTKRIESKKQRNKNTKQTRIVKKTVPTESFFNFFNPPQPPAEDAEDDDDDEIADLEERLQLDYGIGEDIKEKLIPRAIDWFTGEALALEGLNPFEEGDFEDEDDEDLDDLSERDEDDDDEDESDEDVDGPRSAKQDASECKQS